MRGLTRFDVRRPVPSAWTRLPIFCEFDDDSLTELLFAMPIYEYQALNEKGATAKSLIDADSPREAREKLRRQRLFVTDLRPVSDGEKGSRGFSVPMPFTGVKSADVSSITRQLATLLAAGIPLAQALQALIEQVKGGRFEQIMRQVKDSVIQGIAFHEALARHPKAFSPLYVNMVKAGEASGTLDEVLSRLADYLQSQTRLRGRITAALAYPAIMVLVAFGVVTFLMVFIVPDIAGMLTDLGQELPPLTLLVIGISDSFVAYWWTIPFAVIGIYSLWKSWTSSEAGRRMWHKFLLVIPLFGDLFRKVAVSRFAMTFSTLLKSGLPALECLRIVRTVVQNQVLADTLEQVHGRILEGTDIATPMKKSGVFPPVVGYMIAIGEQSGQLEDLLDRIGTAYEEEVELATQKFTSMLEPALIVVMALVVAVIVLSVLLPMLQISQSVGA